jgi:ADP-ribose pyrophosphatase
MLKKLEQISSEIYHENPYWNYNLDKYILPDGSQGNYYYVDSPGSTIIIPRKEDGKYVFIRQYRYLNQKFSIEFPGGGLKKNLEPLENAIEELKEETGFLADEMIFLGENNPCNGMTNEICSVYLATGLVQTGASPDNSEEFEIIELNEKEIVNYINQGEIWDGMTLAAWSIYYFSEQIRV